MTIATTIAQQLGFSLKMIGAKNLISHPDGLSFRVGKNAKRVNYIKISLNASDLYDVTFQRIPSVRQICNGAEVKTISEVSGVYASSLRGVIEQSTGLYTSL